MKRKILVNIIIIAFVLSSFCFIGWYSSGISEAAQKKSQSYYIKKGRIYKKDNNKKVKKK